MSKRQPNDDGEASAPPPPKKSKLEASLVSLLKAKTAEDAVVVALEACPASAAVALAAYTKLNETGTVNKAGKQLATSFVEHGDVSLEHCSQGIAALLLVDDWASIDAKATLEAAVAALKEHGAVASVVSLATTVVATGEDVSDAVAEILEELEADAEAVTKIANAVAETQNASEDLVLALAAAARTHSLGNHDALRACAVVLSALGKREEYAEIIRKTKIAKVFKRGGVEFESEAL